MRTRVGVLILVLVALAVSALGGALSLTLRHQTGLKYEKEWVTALLQAGLVALSGLAASLVLEQFKNRFQQRRDDSKLRFDLLNQISRSYMDVKLLRRRVQRSGTFTETDEDELNQLQVVFELHKHNSPTLFRQGRAIEACLGHMESYLNDVANKPHSEQRRHFTGQGFKSFSPQFKEAAALIREEIAGG